MGSPNNQMHFAQLAGSDVLLSFAIAGKWDSIRTKWQQSWGKILIDSGAYSVMNTPGTTIDVYEYAEWVDAWGDRPDAHAALDSIEGDEKISI